MKRDAIPLLPNWEVVQTSPKGDKVIAQLAYTQDAGLLLSALRKRKNKDGIGLSYSLRKVKPCPDATSATPPSKRSSASGSNGSAKPTAPSASAKPAKPARRRTASMSKRRSKPAASAKAGEARA